MVVIEMLSSEGNRSALLTVQEGQATKLDGDSRSVNFCKRLIGITEQNLLWFFEDPEEWARSLPFQDGIAARIAYDDLAM